MRLVDIPFTHGQDEKVDPKIAPAGVLKRAQNVRRTKDGRWSKRNGYTSLGNTASTDTLNNVARLATRRDELLAIGSRVDSRTERLYSRHNTLSEWNIVDVMPSVSAPSRVGVPNFGSASAEHPDCAVANGHLCVVYDSSTMGRAFIVVYDLSTGSTVYQERLGSTNGADRPRVVACGDTFVATWVDTTPVGDNEIHRFTFNTTTGATAGAVLVTNMLNTSTYYDTCTFSATQFLLCYPLTGGAQHRIYIVTSAGVLGTTVDFNAVGPITILGATGENVHVAWKDGSGNIQFQTWTDALVSVAGPTTLNTDTSNQLMPTIARKDATSVWVAWSGNDTTNVDTFTRWRSVNRSTHALGTLRLFTGLRLASKPLYVSGQLYAWLVSRSTFDRVYVLVLLEDALSAQIMPMTTLARSEAVDFVTADGYGNLVGTDGLYFAFPRIARGLVSSATPYTNVDWASVTPFGTDRYQSAEVAGQTYMAGGMLMVYDGDTADVGFAVAPEINSLTASNSSGTLTSSSTYQYVITREWHDATGNRWVSVPSDPVSVTLGATDDTVAVRYTRPYAAQLKAGSPIRFIGTHVWRTLANGTIFYRMTGDSGLLDSADGSAIGTQITTDVTPDSTLQSNEILYTQGQRGGLSGILEHSPAPPCRYLWAGRDRLIVGGLENRSEVRWSKRFYPGEPVNFSNTDGFKQIVPGTVTAVAELDGLWFAFTEREIFAIAGDGPDDNGAGSSFSPPQRLPSDVGCINWRSVVAVPQGLLFQAAKDRIYLLPRGGAAPIWIGQPVKETLAALDTDAEITGAVLLSEQNVVLITVVDGASGACVLVYDTRTGEWSVDRDEFLPEFSAGATAWQGVAILGTSSLVYQQSAAYADTGGDFIASLLETGEIRPGGLNSNVRVRKVAVLGEHRAECWLTIELSVDDGLTYPYSKTWDLAGLAVGEQVQRVWRLPVQKVGSLKFRISDVTSAGATEGMAFHGLTIEVEGRKGVPRLREAYRG